MAHFARILYPAFMTLALLACAAIVCLNLFIPADASAEYIYTIECLGRYAAPSLALCLLIAFLLRSRNKIRIATKTALLLAALGICLIGLTFWMPPYDYSLWYQSIILSLCWAIGFFCIGLGCFFFAAQKGPIVSTCVCLIGSIFMALGIGEAYLLAASPDGLHYDNAHSRHVLDNKAVAGETNLEYGDCGYHPVEMAVSTGHNYLNFSHVLYDVVYDFDENGRRPTPRAAHDPKYDLLLFGCSFTFGHGLNTQETWPWKLGEDLGPQWHLENYAYSGYSANQMLCLLEHDFISPPTAPERYALFLAMSDHPRRNETFPRSPHYVLDSAGKPRREGQSRFVWVYTMPNYLNGSQLAKKVSKIGLGLIERKYGDEALNLYTAAIAQSAALLKEKYGARLIVLLWPDIEIIAPELQKRNIPFLLAASMLKDWKENASQYSIAPPYENHPNAKAATELATGLAEYFRNLQNESAETLE